MAGTGRLKLRALLAQILIFGAVFAYSQSTPIAVLTNDAGSVTSSSAVLNGTINPGGLVAAGWFEWGTTTSLGTRSDVQMFQDSTSPLNFTATVRNLQPHTTYYFRAVGYRSAAGSPNATGELKTFTPSG